MEILSTFLNIFFVVVCLLLIILILMQSGRSSGMGLMGGSASQSAFGAGSADVLTKMTAILVAIFMISGLAMAFIKSRENNLQKIQGSLKNESILEDDINSEKKDEQINTPETNTNADLQGQTIPETPANKTAP